MKTLAFISEENNTQSAQWQFDKVMAAIAYDLELSIVFVNQGVAQLQYNHAWKCLKIYGVDSVYVVYDKDINNNCLISAKELNMSELKQMISESQLIL